MVQAQGAKWSPDNTGKFSSTLAEPQGPPEGVRAGILTHRERWGRGRVGVSETRKEVLDSRDTWREEPASTHLAWWQIGLELCEGKPEGEERARMKPRVLAGSR